MQTSRQCSFLVKSLKRNHACFLVGITGCIHWSSLQIAGGIERELSAEVWAAACVIDMLATDPTCGVS